MVASHVSSVTSTGTRIVFLGSKTLGVRLLETMAAAAPGVVAAAITLDDRADSRSRFDDLARVASQHGIPLHVASDRKQAEALVGAERPDLCVVACWYWLISPALLESVPRGFIGIHNSLLPKYRGGAPLVWALINNESEVGATFFAFRDGIDDGPVWLQATIRVGSEEHVGEVMARLEDETVRLFGAHFPELLNGSISLREQQHDDATYCAQRLPEDGEIDWTRPGQRVFDFIRAQTTPYPGAFTFIDGRQLTILRAAPVRARYDGTPGQVARVDREGAVVVCGDASAVRVIEVDAGEGRVPAASVIRSLSVRFPRVTGLARAGAAGAFKTC